MNHYVCVIARLDPTETVTGSPVGPAVVGDTIRLCLCQHFPLYRSHIKDGTEDGLFPFNFELV